MSLDQIVNFTSSNIENLPVWFTASFWNFVAAILSVSLLTLLFTAIGNTNFKDPMLAIIRFSISLLKSFFAGSFKAIESPIERPRTKLVIKGLAIVHSYLMCLFFFSIFIALLFASVVGEAPPTMWVKLGQIGILVLMLYFSTFFRAEADRDWLKFKQQLSAVKKETKS